MMIIGAIVMLLLVIGFDFLFSYLYAKYVPQEMKKAMLFEALLAYGVILGLAYVYVLNGTATFKTPMVFWFAVLLRSFFWTAIYLAVSVQYKEASNSIKKRSFYEAILGFPIVILTLIVIDVLVSFIDNNYTLARISINWIKMISDACGAIGFYMFFRLRSLRMQQK
jgi:hypothetical protein